MLILYSAYKYIIIYIYINLWLNVNIMNIKYLVMYIFIAINVINILFGSQSCTVHIILLITPHFPFALRANFRDRADCELHFRSNVCCFCQFDGGGKAGVYIQHPDPHLSPPTPSSLFFTSPTFFNPTTWYPKPAPSYLTIAPSYHELPRTPSPTPNLPFPPP